MSQERVRGPGAVLGLVLPWAAVVLAPELLCHRAYLSQGDGRSVAEYAAGLAASGALFVAIASALGRLRLRRPVLALALAALEGAWLGVNLAFNVPYRLRYGHDLPASYLHFALHNFGYAVSLFREEASESTRAAMALAVAACALATMALIGFRRFRPVSRRLTWALAIGGATVAAASTLERRSSLPADLQGLRSAVAAVRLLATPGQLPDPHRTALPPTKASLRPNVLLVIGETISAHEYAPWSGVDGGTGLCDFFREHPENSVALWDAKTAAGATDISVPALLTGLRADDSAEEFARTPLLWDQARARGYRTGFFSAQDLTWLRLGKFLLGDAPPEVARTAPDYPDAGRVNDNGVDDARVIQAALDFMASTPPDRPWFAAIQLNATHFPAWAPGVPTVSSGLAELLAPDRSRRPKALAYTAHLEGQLLSQLERDGVLSQTLVILTSDHGDNLYRDGAPARLESYYEPVAAVPLGIHLPDEIARARPEILTALRENAHRLASNVDIYPTVVDLWSGVEPGDRGAGGSSLLRATDDDRVVVMVNSGPARAWTRHGFALYHRSWKWIADDHDGLRVFDLAEDPGERTDRIGDVPPPERLRFVQEVRRDPALLQIVDDVDPAILE